MGGADAQANRISVTRADGSIEGFPTGKVNPMRLEPGDGYITETGGGGGFWSPLERPVERVLADVCSGYVSIESAERDYGVMVRAIGRSYEVNADATAALRARRSRGEEMSE
jgi:N-methylhydantoinase B